MLPILNTCVGKITPKQKRDLLGIYQDYLYFSRGFETIIKSNTMLTLSGFFIEQVGWINGQTPPWYTIFASDFHHNAYDRFINEDFSDTRQYAYMSLYHTKKEDDVPTKKIRAIPDDYEYTAIDLNLPCPIERYAAFYPKDQKLKDMTLIIDGRFQISYTGNQYGEMKVLDALHNTKIQKEFRALLNYLEYYQHNMFEIAADPAKETSNLYSAMVKITANEVLSEHENRVLDLLGSYADKALDILRTIYPGKKAEEIWPLAEKDKLISSAENMRHYLNIRQLVRHQWDSLNGTTRFSFARNPKNDRLRDDYLTSYRLIFDKSIAERVKEYQKIAVQMQTLLKAFYPEFLTREVGETNSKFVARIKHWQKDNPDKTPMVNGNYLLKDEKHNALVRNLKKVAPNAVVLDNLTNEDLTTQTYKEQMYFLRTYFLRMYNRIESSIALFCVSGGLKITQPDDAWEYFRTNIFTEQENNKWQNYRQLRNNLSHNHLSDSLKKELDETFVVFEREVRELDDYIYDNFPRHVLLKDNKKPQQQKETRPEPQKIKYPLNLTYGEGEIFECQFDNGITVDFKHKKVIFPDQTRLYFDAKDYNVFRFENGNKLFTDKTFMVTKFQERGHIQKVRRNESFMVAPKHKISTNGACRVAEDCIISSDNKRFITKINYNSDGAALLFADGTKLKATTNEFILSHNNVVLTYDNRHAFKKSYLTVQSSSRER